MRVYVEGENGVVAGAKSPGTPVPTAVGFDPKTRKVRWKKPVVACDPMSVNGSSFSKDALAAGRYVATYREGTETWHAAAFDAGSGDPLWDVTLRGIFAVDRINGVAASEAFVYIVRMSSIEVRGARDGKLVGVVGKETYD
jgi:hypothetical protein